MPCMCCFSTQQCLASYLRLVLLLFNKFNTHWNVLLSYLSKVIKIFKKNGGRKNNRFFSRLLRTALAICLIVPLYVSVFVRKQKFKI